ncbi:hypothetical protein [Arthrobacter sp. zg-Y1110]|uniref:hypothetical protein n=1 Tax=Arthrobacter sp. zg-Y1110 TaxID=2886932 RepID=UPI001D1515BC|nr:hypothetical protein [Arthrobacter sp. zg-Y1110]MCC3292914.1 hypothetical protein [Arthrobacter sp. zg-Y1110]UWX86853.1 hypothetical protein N2K99_18595 [Arthrobacter sp. zg-Y1110]
MRNRTKTTVNRTLKSSRGSFTNYDIVGSLIVIFGLLVMGVFGLATIVLGTGKGILGSGTYTIQLFSVAALAVGTGAFTVCLFVRERARDKAEEALAADTQ